jgi:histone H3/H4
VNQGLQGTYRDILTTYWQQIINHLETDTHDYKLHQLPLARIKKVMKADPEVKMISAEAPILFAKGCDIFITELTMRAWIHAEENKRRTLQRSDIASALAKSDMFDFLIDIVPREEAASHAKRASGQNASTQGVPAAGGQLPAQGSISQQQPSHQPQQHAMAPPDYSLGHGLAPEQDYRQPGMYPGQVQPGPVTAYGQAPPHMYAEIDGMYGYPPMQPQQVIPCTSFKTHNIYNANVSLRCITSHNEPKILQLVKMRATTMRAMMEVKETLMLKVKGIMKLLSPFNRMLWGVEKVRFSVA